MVPQILMLLFGESKHKVIREPFHVPCYCTIKCFCLYPVELCSVSIPYDSMTTDDEDCLFNSFTRYQRAHVSSPLCSIHHEAANRYPVHCAKSTNGKRKWNHYDGVSAATTVVKWKARKERDRLDWRDAGLVCLVDRIRNPTRKPDRPDGLERPDRPEEPDRHG